MGDLNLIGGDTSNKSNIAVLGEKFDPTSWFTKAVGMEKSPLNPHTIIKPGTDKLNKWVGKVTGPINKLNTQIEPGANMLDQTELGHAWNQTIENRPVDAAAIAAAMFFGGGALAGAGGAAGGAGASTGFGAGSTAAGMQAITPAFSSGVGAVGTGSTIGGLGSGLGTLGASGTAAGMSALTPSFMGGAGASGGFLSGMSTYDKINYAKKLAELLNPASQPDQYTNTNSPIGSYHNYHLPRSY